MLLAFMLATSSVLAQPPASEIANQIEQYWKNYEFNELETYINTLYQNYPNYIPAILAKSFYHSAFRNHLSDSLVELNRIVEAVKNNPGLGSKDFRETLDAVKKMTERFIEGYQKDGVTQEELSAAASVQEGREVWGNTPLREFELISLAPNESIH